MRAILVTDFPDSFVRLRVLPELRRRVDVILVTKTRAASSEIDLASYEPDVILHMVEFGSHSTSAVLSATCRRAGISVRALSRKKASWSFLPPPRPLPVAVPAVPLKEKPKMEHQKNGNGTPIRATIGDIPGARAVLRPDPPAAILPPAPVEKKQEAIALEFSPGSLAVISSLTQAFGKHGADAILEHARAMRELAKAIAGMPAAIEHGGAEKEPPKPKIDAVETKLLEVIGKFGGLSLAELFVLVVAGAGGEGVKVLKNSLGNALSKLARNDKVTRTGIGGPGDPYRYFIPPTP